MTTKIIDTPFLTIHPKWAHRRTSDNALVFIYANQDLPRTLPREIWEAVSLDEGVTWTPSLILSASTYQPGLGGTGITDVGTEIFTTSHYNKPIIITPPTTTYNSPVDVWRKESGGSWSLDSTFPKPADPDVQFVPFGRVITLDNGVIRMTAGGVDFARTYAHVYYCDSSDDGMTWSNPVTIRKEFTGGNEQCYYADGDNHICAIRNEDEQGVLEGGVRIMKSTDAGVSWSDMGEISAAIDRYATAPDLMRLSDGRMALLFGDRGDVGTPFGDEQQHMSMAIGQFVEIFEDIANWSGRIDLADIFPVSPGSSGYGGLFKITDLDSSLQVTWMDSVTSTDRDIYQKAVGDLIPTVSSFSQGAIVG